MNVDKHKLVIALVLVFLLGIFFAWVNGMYVNETNQQLPFVVYIISFVSVLLGSGLVLLFQWKITHHQLSQFLALLPREERLIIQILLDNNKKIEQNKLVVLSSYTKVQVSRIVQRLVERGVVERRQMGNTNLVMLKV